MLAARDPGVDTLPAEAFFCAFGYPKETGGQSLCCQSLPDKHPSLGFEVGSGRTVRLQLDKGLPEGYSGGPVMLLSGSRAACFGIARLGGSRAATSVILPTDEVLPFLEEHGVKVIALSMRDFLADAGSITLNPPRATAVTNSVVNFAREAATGQTNVGQVGRDLVIKPGKEVAIVGLCVVALLSLVIVALGILRQAPPSPPADRSEVRPYEQYVEPPKQPVPAEEATDKPRIPPAPEPDPNVTAAARERSLLHDMATSALRTVEELDGQMAWRNSTFLPLETNLQGRLIATQPNLVASMVPLLTNQFPSLSEVTAMRLTLEHATATLNSQEKQSPAYTPPQTLIETVLETSRLAEQALLYFKPWRRQVEAILASARAINEPGQRTLREAIAQSQLEPPRPFVVLEQVGTPAWVVTGRRAIVKQGIQKGTLTKQDGGTLDLAPSYTPGEKVQILTVTSERVEINSVDGGDGEGWLEGKEVEKYLKPAE